MKRLIVMACCGVFIATLVMSAAHAADPAAVNRERASESAPPPTDCGGEPCDAVLRGLFAFFDRSPHGLDGNGRSCADCHMPTDSFQLSPANAEARFRFLEWRRRWDPNADDPLFRPIDADDFRTNGENASDFSNLRQNGLIRITFPLPPNVRLIVPGSTDVSNETFVDVWRAVPTVNDVALTGPDGTRPGLAARSRTDRRISIGCASRLAAGAGARGAASIMRRSRTRCRKGCSTTWPPFSACCSRTIAFGPLSDAVRDRCTVAGSGSAAQRTRGARQGCLRARVRAVSWRSGPIDTSAAGRSIPRYRDAVSASRRYRQPAALCVCAVPGSPPAKCANLRDHTADRREDPSHELRSGSGAVNGGCRLWPRGAPGRLEQVRCPRTPRPQKHGTVLPQQQRRDA